jgi:hypothetical protein
VDAFRIQGLLDVQAGGFARGMEDSRVHLQRLRQETRGTTRDVRILATEERDLTRALREQSRAVSALTLQYVGLRKAMLNLAVRTAVTGMAATASSATALASGLFEVAQGAGAAASALGIGLVAGVGALAQGLIVARLATKDLWKALTTQGTAHEKALAKLTAPARAFVGELRSMQTQFQEIKRLAQVGLFPGLVDGLKKAAPLLKPLKQIVYDTARTLGYLGDQLGGLLGRRAGDISTLGSRQIVVLRRIGEAAINLADAFISLYNDAWPLIGHLFRDLVHFSKQISDGVKANGSQLRSFFADLRQHYDEWKLIVGGLGGTIINMMHAANPAVHQLDQLLGSMFAKWREWSGSAAGQRELGGFFQSQLGPLKAMGRFVGELAKAWAELSIAGADNAIKFWDMLSYKVVPLLRDLGLQLNEGFFPAFVDLIGSVSDLIRAALPGIKQLGSALHIVMVGISGILEVGTGLVQNAPGIEKAILAFGIGAGVLAGYGKLRLAISLVLLGMRRMLGLSREIAVLRPGLALLGTRGGRLDKLESSAQAAAGYGQAAGVSPVAVAPGAGRARGGVAEAPTWLNQPGGRSGLRTGIRPGFAPVYSPRDGGLGRVFNPNQYESPIGPRRLYGAAADPRYYANARRVLQIMPPLAGYSGFRGGFRVPEMPRLRVLRRYAAPYARSGPGTPLDTIGRTPEMSPTGMASLPPGYRTQAYRNFQSTDNRSALSRGGRRLFGAADLATDTARATVTGLRNGMSKARPLLRAGFAIGATAGLITALSSHGPGGLSNKLQDFFSGATFGAIPSASGRRDKKTASLAQAIKGGQFTAQTLGQFDLSRLPALPEKFRRSLFGGGGGKPGSFKTKIDLATNPEQVRALTALVDQLTKAGQLAPDAGQKIHDALSKINGELDKLTSQGLHGKELQQALTLGLNIDLPVARATGGLNDVKDAFDALGKTHGLHELRKNVKANIEIINGELGRGSQVGRLALARNFRLAADAVRDQMKRGEVSTKTGTAQIRKYLISALTEMNPSWDRKDAGLYLHGKDPVTGRPINSTGGNGKMGQARGGLTRVPGKVGPDSVPAMLGGIPAVVAPGEDIAVLTRHQRKGLDEMTGGLAGWLAKNNTAHNHPAAFGNGGLVTGDTDYRPEVGKALEAMALSTGQSIFVRSGGRTMAEQAILYQRYLEGKGNLAAKPDPAAPHVAGRAADISPGRSVFGGVAGRFGLGFTVPSEDWHIELLKLIGATTGAGSGGGTSSAVDAPTLPTVQSTIGGMLGQLVNAGLAAAGQAAQGTLEQATSAQSGSGQAGIPSFSGPWVSVMAKIADSLGWSLPDWKWVVGHESGGQVSVKNPTSTAFGLGQLLDSTYAKYGGGPGSSGVEQIRAMAAYIRDRYVTPTAAKAFWEANHYYGGGGLIEHSATPPGRNQGTPDVSVDVPLGSQGGRDTSGHKKKKKKARKKAKPKAPFTGGHPYPKLSKIKGKIKRHGGSADWRSRYGKWEMPEGADALPTGLVPDFESLYDIPIEHLSNLISSRGNEFDATDEQAVVTLQDSGSFKDLTTYWANNPALAAEWKDEVDSWDVVNWDGQSVQGKHVRGIYDHVHELEELLGLHTGAPDGLGTTGLLSMLTGELTAQGDASKRVGISRLFAVDTLKQIHHAWNAEAARREHAREKVKKLSSGSQSWEQRVADNKARIDKIEEWKRQVRDDTIGHRQTEELKHELVKADSDIARLREENTTLADTKPAPKRQVPKGASKALREKIRKENEQRTHQVNHWSAVRDDAARELDFLDGDRDRWGTGGGVAKQWSDRLDAHNAAMKELADTMRGLADVAIPGEQQTIVGLIGERADWLGTTAILPLHDQAAGGDQQSTIDDLKQTLLDQALQNLAVSQAQFSMLSGFQGLVQGRIVGAFAHGGPITETGLALVHKGEHVITDPDGPFRTGPNSAARMGGQGDVHVHVDVDGHLAPFVKMVDARIAAQAPHVASSVTGRRSRQLSKAPGRTSR